MAVLRHLIVSETASGGDSVTVPVYGAVELTQSYRPLEARTLYRYADGSAALRAQWSGKLATEISGKGLIPPALSGLDYRPAHGLGRHSDRQEMERRHLHRGYRHHGQRHAECAQHHARQRREQ